MINLSLQKRIERIENKLITLKKDYKSFEKNYRETDRNELINDIQKIRLELNVFIQKIRDLRGLN